MGEVTFKQFQLPCELLPDGWLGLKLLLIDVVTFTPDPDLGDLQVPIA